MLHLNIPSLIQGLAVLALAAGLVCLWLEVHRLKRTLRRIGERLDLPPRSMPEASGPGTPRPEAIDDRVLAAIAAAVVTVIRQPHRIIAIHPDANAQLAWSAEGRRELYHSHNVR